MILSRALFNKKRSTLVRSNLTGLEHWGTSQPPGVARIFFAQQMASKKVPTIPTPAHAPIAISPFARRKKKTQKREKSGLGPTNQLNGGFTNTFGEWWQRVNGEGGGSIFSASDSTTSTVFKYIRLRISQQNGGKH